MRRWLTGIAVGLLLALGIASLLGRAGALHGDDGILWEETKSGLRAVRVEREGPGDRAGIRGGDRLLLVEGRQVARLTEIRDLLWSRAGVLTSYRLLRDGEEMERHLLPVTAGEENRPYYYLFLVGLLGLGAGSFAASRLPFEPAARLLLLLSASFYLILALSPSGEGGTLDWVFYWGDLLGRLLMPPLLVHFILRITRDDDGRTLPRLILTALYLPAAILLAGVVYLIPLRGALAFTDPVGVVALKDRLEILYLSTFAAGAAALLTVRLWTATPARVRWRMRWLALSSIAGLLPLTLLYLVPIALKITPGTVGELSIFPLALVPLGFAAALLQDRTVDLDRTLRLAVRMTLAGFVLLGGGLAISWCLGHLGGGLPQAGLLTEVLVPFAGAVLLLTALRRPLGKLVQKAVGRPHPEVTRTLLEFRSDLNGEIRLEVLAANFLARLQRSFSLERVALLVRDGAGAEFHPEPPPVSGKARALPVVSLDPPLQRRLAAAEMILLSSEAELPGGGSLAAYLGTGCRYLFPMTVQGDLKALLLASPHRDGAPLGSTELEVLAALASQAARSVEGARLHAEIRTRIEEEKRLRSQSQGILEASRIGILLADPRGRVTAANAAASRILGLEDLAGEDLESVLPRGLLLLLDRRGSRGESRKEGERAYRCSFGAADGRTRIINVTRAPLSAEPGSGQVYTLDDVTEEAQREERILGQEHLASVGRLMSEVAHEVNTPLTGIASYAQILMSRLASRLPEMDLLRKIEAQAFRAAGIAGSVLSFSGKKEGELPLILEPGEVIAECLTLFEAHLKGKRIRMVTDRAASLPLIRIRRGGLQQVVMNLLLNAADALPEGGEVRLDLGREGTFFRLRVSDDGIGISTEVLPRIFEPFFTTKSAGKGTGLGLAVVRRIVQEHGGRIQVETREGSGATFTVLLPVQSGATWEAARGA